MTLMPLIRVKLIFRCLVKLRWTYSRIAKAGQELERISVSQKQHCNLPFGVVRLQSRKHRVTDVAFGDHLAEMVLGGSDVSDDECDWFPGSNIARHILRG